MPTSTHRKAYRTDSPRRFASPIVRACAMAFALSVALTGCADVETLYRPVQTVALTAPIPTDDSPAECREQGETPSYYWGALKDCTAQDSLVVFAFSGGGIRSAAFGYGALQAAHRISLPDETGGTRHTLDTDIDAVSGVSGGSFTAAAFASKGTKLFADGKPDYYRDNFLTHDFFADLLSLYLSPLHWRWLFPDYGTNDEMAQIYGAIPFSNDRDALFAANFGVLARKGRPFLVIQATDYGNEQPFTFTQDDFDLICADVRSYPVGAAIAASSAFPVLFSPIQLANRHFTHGFAQTNGYCRTHRPPWVDTILAQPEPADLSRLYARARAAAHYLPDTHTPTPVDPPRYVYLQDGGASDNVALRGMTNILIENLPELEGLSERDDARLCQSGFARLRKILIVAVDGEAQPNRKIAAMPYLSDLGLILDVTSSAMIDANGFETMLATDALTRKLAARLSTLSCNGAPPRPVSSYFARVSFQDLNAAVRLPHLAACGAQSTSCSVDDLAHSETSLNFTAVQVDALIAAGRSAFLCNAKIAQYLHDSAADIGISPDFDCARSTARASPETAK